MHSFLPVYAQAAAAQGSSGMWVMVIQFGAIFAIFYFLMIRPQQKQRKTHEANLLGLRKGDEIVTSGGLVGEVVHIKEGVKDGTPAKTLDDRVTIKTGEARVVVERGRIAKVLGSNPSEAKD
ncbi:MAG: preprotein translocase subunit YajC [Gemmatimonadetes bacterium]|nr:preprotein translocase subunit YajC [Gemmatimonadota bacterium]MBI3569459.1 preprotein translocase subunit YajC [Gemmatimonadota bacterium]